MLIPVKDNRYGGRYSIQMCLYDYYCTLSIADNDLIFKKDNIWILRDSFFPVQRTLRGGARRSLSLERAQQLAIEHLEREGL